MPSDAIGLHSASHAMTIHMKTDRRDLVKGGAAGIVPLPTQPLWIITENVMESAPIKVDVPGRAPGRPPRRPGFAELFA